MIDSASALSEKFGSYDDEVRGYGFQLLQGLPMASYCSALV
jgi:hypothetical protein